MGLKYQWPTANGVKPRVTSAFGPRPASWNVSGQHSGVDFGMSGGTPIAAVADGVVHEIGQNMNTSSGAGIWTVVRHSDGYFSHYYHQQSRAGGIAPGVSVARGQVIGYVDSTGASTGNHLHLGIGTGSFSGFTDPEPFIAARLNGEDAGVPSSGSSVTWDGISTDFKGNYETQLDGGIHTVPVGGPWPSQVAAQHGVSLDQVAAWTEALAASKWAGNFLQPGGSYLTRAMLTGGATFYAGGVYTVVDAVGILTARENAANAAVLAQQQAADESFAKATAARAAAEVEATSFAVAEAAAEVAAKAEADAVEQAEALQVEAAAKVEAAKAAKQLELRTEQATAMAVKTAKAVATAQQLQREVNSARIELVSVGESVEVILETSAEVANKDAALAGILAGNPVARKRAYYVYSVAALFISFGPIVALSGVLPIETVPTVTTWISLASALLLQIGTAFGFVAASNTGKQPKSD